MIEKIKKTLKTGHSAVFGGGTLLSRNDRVWGTTQHSQVEFDSSQAETSNKQVFLALRERLGEGTNLNSVAVKQLQKPNGVTSSVARF